MLAFLGGGACLGTLNNCVLIGNSADLGGGAVGVWYTQSRCTLNNCLLYENWGRIGGGAFECVELNNCTLVGNSSDAGGGVGTAAFGMTTLTNCIVYFNTARNGADNYGGDVLFNHCCTLPRPSAWGDGGGNITNAPLFAGAATGNYRLRPDSPCINTGINAFAAGPTDLDGKPRIVSGAVDMGAYEYSGTTNTYTFVHAGYTRTYSVYLPSGCSRTNPAPLVLQLTPNAAVRPALYGMNRVAEREAFLVTYPDPFADNWMGPTRTDPYDDIGFLLEVIKRICMEYSVKSDQIYAGGYSAGGVMSEYLGRKVPYKLAAVASVAAVRPYVQGTTQYMPPGSPATPCRPFPFLHIHGTADTIGPYGGGYFQGWNWPPVDQVLADYIRSNGCALTPWVTNLPNVNLADGCTVQLLNYTNGQTYLDAQGTARAAEVVYYRVPGGGHSQPGDYQGWETWAFPVNRDIEATEEIWTFFSRHRAAAVPPGRFEDLRYSATEGFQCMFRDAAVGECYRIQISTSLLPGSWTDVTNVTYTGPVTIKDGAFPGPGMKFYRTIHP